MATDLGKEIGSWLRDHETLLYKIVWSCLRTNDFTPSQDDVNWVAADAMRRMWEYRHTFSPRTGDLNGDLRAWASQVTRGACIAALREARAEQKRKDRYLSALSFHPTTEHPEKVYIQRETIVTRWEQLNGLQRATIYMQYQGYDYQEIAHELGITASQVKHTLDNARRRARDVQAGS